jgi:hypothetical protein
MDGRRERGDVIAAVKWGDPEVLKSLSAMVVPPEGALTVDLGRLQLKSLARATHCNILQMCIPGRRAAAWLQRRSAGASGVSRNSH